jgi:hypothetical protein
VQQLVAVAQDQGGVTVAMIKVVVLAVLEVILTAQALEM